MCDAVEQSLSVEDKVLLAQAASERAAIVAKYDKVGSVWFCSACHFTESWSDDVVFVKVYRLLRISCCMFDVEAQIFI